MSKKLDALKRIYEDAVYTLDFFEESDDGGTYDDGLHDGLRTQAQITLDILEAHFGLPNFFYGEEECE